MINPTWPSSDLVAITPSDATVYSPHLRMIYCGSTGNISVTTAEGTTVSFIGVPTGGSIGPFFITKVNATGTTATSLIGFY
jgi:hypothetical protein